MKISISNQLTEKGKVFKHPDVISGTVLIDSPPRYQTKKTQILSISLQGYKESAKFFHVNFYCAPIEFDAHGAHVVTWYYQVPQKIQKESSFQCYSTLLEAMQRYSNYKLAGNPQAKSRSSSITSISSCSSASSSTSFQAYNYREKQCGNFDECQVHEELPPTLEDFVTYTIAAEIYCYETGKFITQSLNEVCIRNDTHIVSSKIDNNEKDPWLYYSTNKEYDGRVAYKIQSEKDRFDVTIPIPETVNKQQFDLVIHSSLNIKPRKIKLRSYNKDETGCQTGDKVMEGVVDGSWNLKVVEEFSRKVEDGTEQHFQVELPTNVLPSFHHCFSSRTYSMLIDFGHCKLPSSKLEVPLTIGNIN